MPLLLQEGATDSRHAMHILLGHMIAKTGPHLIHCSIAGIEIVMLVAATFRYDEEYIYIYIYVCIHTYSPVRSSTDL